MFHASASVRAVTADRTPSPSTRTGSSSSESSEPGQRRLRVGRPGFEPLVGLRDPGEEVADPVMLGFEPPPDQRHRRPDGAHLLGRSARRSAANDEHRAARLMGDPLADAAERLQTLQPTASDHDEVGRLGLGREQVESAAVPLLELRCDYAAPLRDRPDRSSRTRCVTRPRRSLRQSGPRRPRGSDSAEPSTPTTIA